MINAIKSNETDYSWRTQNGTRKYIFIWSFKMILQISPSQSLTSNQSLIIFLAIEYFNESFESVNSLFEYLTFTGETIYATWAQNNHEVICLNNAIDGNWVIAGFQLRSYHSISTFSNVYKWQLCISSLPCAIIFVTLSNMTSAAPLSVVLTLFSKGKEGKRGCSGWKKGKEGATSGLEFMSFGVVTILSSVLRISEFNFRSFPVSEFH